MAVTIHIPESASWARRRFKKPKGRRAVLLEQARRDADLSAEPDGGGRRGLYLLLGLVGLGLAAVLMEGPELRRYMKMRSM